MHEGFSWLRRSMEYLRGCGGDGGIIAFVSVPPVCFSLKREGWWEVGNGVEG